MTTQANEKLEVIQRVSRRLKSFFILLAVGTLGGTLAMLLGDHPDVRIAGVRFASAELTGTVRALWVGASVLIAAVLLKLCFHLIKLFGLYSQGKIFTQQNVAQIRQVGVSLLLLPAVWLLAAVGAASQSEASPDLWSLLVTSFPFAGLVGGGTIMPIAWIMDAGCELREEHELVI